MKKVNLKDIVEEIKEPWQPKAIAHVNDTALRVAMIHGEYHWHIHREEDEFFYVLKGSIYVDLQSESFKLKQGEGLVVKKGIRHRSRAHKPAWVLLIEPTRTKTKGESE